MDLISAALNGVGIDLMFLQYCRIDRQLSEWYHPKGVEFCVLFGFEWRLRYLRQMRHA